MDEVKNCEAVRCTLWKAGLEHLDTQSAQCTDYKKLPVGS